MKKVKVSLVMFLSHSNRLAWDVKATMLLCLLYFSSHFLYIIYAFHIPETTQHSKKGKIN